MPRSLPVETLHGRRVFFVMAAQAEYGPHLRARFRPLITGVGPVEAAVSVAFALARLEAAGAAPDLVVSLGSAGSARLEQCAIYQATRVAYRDMDASPLGFARGQTPFLDLPPVLDLGHRIAGLDGASLSTGANIVSGAGYGPIAEDMVDMETYAVLRACHGAEVPLVALRGISDGAKELTQVSDWTEYLHIIDERLAQATDRLAAAIEAGLLS
ncbi:5'-methylthioadenosine/S-adenosylhomocysteine nucleosidase [Pararhodobacter sp.]|uniref:5'-methylthioadenosine/S-adenosylhomocysteine nucleosidase n=1 Tax=Pararhodobacter sp. TaxID=2127056 RepID=UPI002FDD74E6